METKFKVGDKVKIISQGSYQSGCLGDICVVKKAYINNGGTEWIELHGNSYSWKYDEIELYEELSYIETLKEEIKQKQRELNKLELENKFNYFTDIVTMSNYNDLIMTKYKYFDELCKDIKPGTKYKFELTKID